MPDKIRVVCFVDGFNLYYAIRALNDETLSAFDVNLRRLASQFINPKKEVLKSVHYFYAPWKEEKGKEQSAYLARLRATQVKLIPGKFQHKIERCKQCETQTVRHIEKLTDVNLAVAILSEAVSNTYDRALVITNDSDISGGIRTTKKLFPNKKIIVLTPPGKQAAFYLTSVASTCLPIEVGHLALSRFDWKKKERITSIPTVLEKVKVEVFKSPERKEAEKRERNEISLSEASFDFFPSCTIL